MGIRDNYVLSLYELCQCMSSGHFQSETLFGILCNYMIFLQPVVFWLSNNILKFSFTALIIKKTKCLQTCVTG